MGEIKAYFFDWGETLASVREGVSTSGTFGEDIKHHLFMGPFHKVPFKSSEDRELAYRNLSNPEIKLYDDSETTILELRDKGSKLAIVSNIYEPTVSKICQMFPDFIFMFDFTTFSSNVGLVKPDHEIFRYTLRELNKSCNTDIDFSQVVMVGDNPRADYYPALELGMQAKVIDRIKGETLKGVLGN